MSLASATRSFLTMCPLMSRPRMFSALVCASSGVAAYFTPPALPRPPVLTCALIITGLPISSAIARASVAESVTRPGVVGTPCLANSSFAWYSKRSIQLTISSLCPLMLGVTRAISDSKPAGHSPVGGLRGLCGRSLVRSASPSQDTGHRSAHHAPRIESALGSPHAGTKSGRRA